MLAQHSVHPKLILIQCLCAKRLHQPQHAAVLRFTSFLQAAHDVVSFARIVRVELEFVVTGKLLLFVQYIGRMDDMHYALVARPISIVTVHAGYNLLCFCFGQETALVVSKLFTDCAC